MSQYRTLDACVWMYTLVTGPADSGHVHSTVPLVRGTCFSVHPTLGPTGRSSISTETMSQVVASRFTTVRTLARVRSVAYARFINEETESTAGVSRGSSTFLGTGHVHAAPDHPSSHTHPDFSPAAYPPLPSSREDGRSRHTSRPSSESEVSSKRCSSYRSPLGHAVPCALHSRSTMSPFIKRRSAGSIGTGAVQCVLSHAFSIFCWASGSRFRRSLHWHTPTFSPDSTRHVPRSIPPQTRGVFTLDTG